MVDVLRVLIPSRDLLRAAVVLGLHAFLIFCVASVVCLWPGRAFALSGYSRVMTVAQWNAMWSGPSQVARVSSAASAIAAAAGNPVSVAVRAVTGPIGWASIGIAAGIAIGEMFWNQNQVAQIQSGAAPPTWQISGYNLPSGAQVVSSSSTGTGTSCTTAQYDYCITTAAQSGLCNMAAPPSPWLAWYTPVRNSAVVPNTCEARHPVGGANGPTQIPGVPTQTNVTNYLNGLPSNDPNSVPTNTHPLGSGVSPTPASNVTTDPVDTTQAQTTVVPTSQKPSGSVTLDDNATPPAGTQTTQTGTQPTSTTTSTTTNPDGSTTQQQTETATASCSTGNHEQRTFGGILQSHIDTWKGSGIVGTLALLQSLTWPSALPTITLTSGTWGTHNINFNDWSAMFTALRAIVIAGAGFAAYRIVFVGGGGS